MNLEEYEEYIEEQDCAKILSEYLEIEIENFIKKTLNRSLRLHDKKDLIESYLTELEEDKMIISWSWHDSRPNIYFSNRTYRVILNDGDNRDFMVQYND